MHIFFSGIGGTGIGPLALIAKQAGFEVSGSDIQDSQYIQYLKKRGINDITIDQSKEAIAKVHETKPIDWFVYSSSLTISNSHPAELEFCEEQQIKTSKRDELLNHIITSKNLKLVAIAGTHGKTTTTAMVVWLFKQLQIPVSYSVGAKISFGDMGQYEAGSEYFVYECDEFDRNFLAFNPHLSIITGVSWDHHEVFPTREDYQQAFREFIDQSQTTILWDEDNNYLELDPNTDNLIVQDSDSPRVNSIKLHGHYNRLDAWLAVKALMSVTDGVSEDVLVEHINRFPGSQRRMEPISDDLYSDYAHTPEKVRGAMSIAIEMAQEQGKDLVVLYEPLTNRRQHYMRTEYNDCFEGANKLYWLPSYLAREDPAQRIIPPEELISHISNPEVAEPATMGEELHHIIREHIRHNCMVVAMTGGGGSSLDEWLREKFQNPKN
jgi:UDP-N-acetylmuramate--alanine ligase